MAVTSHENVAARHSAVIRDKKLVGQTWLAAEVGQLQGPEGWTTADKVHVSPCGCGAMEGKPPEGASAKAGPVILES